MTNTPGAAVTAVGVLLALLCQGTATAQGGVEAPREVSGGFASWDPVFGAPVDAVATVTAEAPAVRGSGGRTWFPVGGGSAVPRAGDADVDLDGSIRLGGAGSDTLTLGELRLRLDGGTGTLRVRAERAGEGGDLTLAEVGAGSAPPTVRSGGATWSGLRVSLTAEGARLLAEWSGRSYAAGDRLAPLDVTVGTGSSEAGRPEGGAMRRVRRRHVLALPEHGGRGGREWHRRHDDRIRGGRAGDGGGALRGRGTREPGRRCRTTGHRRRLRTG